MSDSPIRRAVVAGSGTMGASLAQIFAQYGLEVTLWNRSEEGLCRAGALIRSNQAALIASGRIGAEASGALLARIHPSVEEACFKNAGFIIESIAENLELKQEFFRRVSALAPADCLIVTNTSGLSITALASAVAHPARFAGMHWINPPHLIPLVEIVQGEQTAPETMDAVFSLALSLGKHPIRAKDVPGFILNRLQFAVLREALHLVESGAAGLEDIDGAMKYGLGMRYACVGPFETADLGGIDVFRKIASYLFPDLDDGKQVPALLEQLCAQGALGVKSGRGFYDYGGGKAEAAVEMRDRKFIAVADALNAAGDTAPQ